MLGALAELTFLDLSDNNLDDTEGISELPRLTILRIANNRFYDVSILDNLSRLQELDVSGNDLTEEDIAALRDAMPDCRISF